jgi:hypothetical protein
MNRLIRTGRNNNITLFYSLIDPLTDYVGLGSVHQEPRVPFVNWSKETPLMQAVHDVTQSWGGTEAQWAKVCSHPY